VATFVYSTVPGKIKQLLEKIRGVGVPSKVTVQYLKTIGFTSSNDSSLVSVLKFIGFIDAHNAPTQKWLQYRGSNHKSVLGEALREAYKDLFDVYPDAQSRSRQDLEHVFSTSTSGGKEVISKLVSTFKIMCDEAEFGSPSKSPTGNPTKEPAQTPATVGEAPARSHRPGNASLHIDIQVHISPESSPEQFEQIFASMAKHLYGHGKE
jgi:hypothetical protein